MERVVCGYEFTLKNSIYITDEIKKWLVVYCKKWCFVVSTDEPNEVLYRGYFSLKTRQRPSTVVNSLPEKLKNICLKQSPALKKDGFYNPIKDQYRYDYKTEYAISGNKYTRPSWINSIITLIKEYNNTDKYNLHIIECNVRDAEKRTLACDLGLKNKITEIDSHENGWDILETIVGGNIYFVDLYADDDIENIGLCEDLEYLRAGKCQVSINNVSKIITIKPPLIFIFISSYESLKRALDKSKWSFYTINNNRLIKS